MFTLAEEEEEEEEGGEEERDPKNGTRIGGPTRSWMKNWSVRMGSTPRTSN